MHETLCRIVKELYAEVVDMVCYVIKMSTSTIVELKIPKEFWTGKSVDYSSLHIFGCHAYIHVQVGQRTNWMQLPRHAFF